MESAERNHEFVHRMRDGTVKQVSALTGTVVWTVPGRANRPLVAPARPARPLRPDEENSYCPFCPARYLETPPEKTRLVRQSLPRGDTAWVVVENAHAEQASATVAEFRRVPNLFPIMPASSWQINYGQAPSAAAWERARAYVATTAGRAHLAALPITAASGESTPASHGDEALAQAVSYFAATHDLIIARRHFVAGATDDSQLASAGELSPAEHLRFLEYTVDALADLAASGPWVRYVAVFQNWLRPAGASFDHLHKQLVAIDEFGPQLRREIQQLADDPQLYNNVVADPAIRAGLAIARNEHAIAVAGVGHRFPTVEIYSTDSENRPWEHGRAALRSMSDLLHACHAATGARVSTNEEWHYRPPRAAAAMPWRINLKWRISTPAGFEGATKIYVNTIDPWALRARVVARLTELRANQRIADLLIGDECAPELGVLEYARTARRA